MRFHLLALPNVQTTAAYSLDGFCSATIRFARLLKSLGHTVILYASEENEAPCDELVTVITKEEQKVLLDGIPYQYAALDNKGYPLWALANNRAIVEIGKRKQPPDFICTIGGSSQEPIARAHSDLMTVEYSIGYVSQFAPYRVFESHYWRAMSNGLAGNWDGRFFDETIPLFFDESEFAFRKDKEPFALYVGRLVPKKGLETACRAAQLAGIKLKVIGHGDESLVTHGAEYVGTVGQQERNDYMSRASVLICPTLYVEPFGSVAVEAQLCGTPVVSTDFGGFVETVEHGKTGYRCKYLGEFVKALRDAPTLDPRYIRDRAVANYSLGAVAPLYQAYFERLMLLWGDGWNTAK
jgi:glycosyltransferase involved in cell wall biosynthesis